MPCLMKTWSRLSSVIYGRNECRLKRVTGGGPALPRISQQQFNKQNPGGAIGGGSIGRVEDGRGRLGHAATLRFPSPLVEPDVPISGIRLSDWLHREAHNGTVRGRR